MSNPKDPADMSQEEHDWWEKQVEDAAELKLLREVFAKAKEMIFTECNGGKPHLEARLAFKGAVQKMMQFEEGTVSGSELSKLAASA